MKRLIAISLFWALSFIQSPCLAQELVYKDYQRLLGQLENHQRVKQFIDADNYLSDRLLKKWLFYLAKNKQWQQYLDAYVPINNLSLKCYYLTSLYETGKKEKSFSSLEALWLKTHKHPSACQHIITAWTKSAQFSDKLLWQRFKLALDARQYKVARSLLIKMSDEDLKIAKLWIAVSRNPRKLQTLKYSKHPQMPAVYIHGLRKLVKIKTKNALTLWKKVKNQYPFSHSQKQEFLRTVALYAAMRNREDSEFWFKQLDVSLTPRMHLEWRVRAALRARNWAQVKNAIDAMPKALQVNPCWQYWYARAHQALGNDASALAIYKELSQIRHYYGFLASHQARLPFNMQHSDYEDNDDLIEPYQNQIQHINELYKNKSRHKANLLSYELTNSISRDAQYQLAREYADWQWHEKALMLANLSEYKHDLRLRFPLAHRSLVNQFSKKYDIEGPLIYAIIRQESTFRKGAKSSANAMGLMQVIPSTARSMARQNKVPLGNLKKMYQAKTNMNIGTAYLNHLAKRFKNHPVLMAAAYNAGPRQVNYWLKKFPATASDIWIETLPWGETRNYLKNVLSFYAVYQYRLERKPSLKAFMRPIKL